MKVGGDSGGDDADDDEMGVILGSMTLHRRSFPMRVKTDVQGL